jgi:5-methylcytosine-specific restriction endonuclease McrA
VRQIEQMVSGRKPGDGPNDPADEAHRRHVIRLEVSGATYATFREMMAKIRRDAGEPLDDDAAVMMMARQVLGGPKDPGRSNYQVKLDVCENCRRGRQEGRGQMVEVPPEVVEMAECDGQQIGVIPSRVDPHVGQADRAPEEPSTKPVRATQSIPPSERRKVLRRDRGCCVVPGCTHGSFLDVHHIKPREEGGGHDADQLVTLCGAHHAAVHQGRIVIEGCASERLEFFHVDGKPYGAIVSPDIVDLKTKAFQALRHMGFKETEARRALDAVETHGGAMTLESILKQALLALT